MCMILGCQHAMAAEATTVNVDKMSVTYYSSSYYSQPDWYCYYFELEHSGTSDIDVFPQLSFNIYQETNDGLVSGTYRLEDESLTGVVLTRNLEDAIAQELGGYTWEAIEAVATVTVKTDGKVALSMDIEDAEGVQYHCEIETELTVRESKQDPINDPYILERQDAQKLDLLMDELVVDDAQFYTQNTMALRLKSNKTNAEGLFYRSVLWVNTDSQIPAAGVYPILATGELGSVDASYGYDTIAQQIYPSFIALSDVKGNLYDPDIFFMVQGEVEISYPSEDSIRIEVDALSWFKSSIHYVYQGKLNYAPAETKTYDVKLSGATDLKNTGYLGLIEYSLQVMGRDANNSPLRITLDLKPEIEAITGHFCKAEGTLGTMKSCVEWLGIGSLYQVADGDFVITGVKDGIYSLNGWLRDDRGNRYNLTGDELEIEFISSDEYHYEQENPDARRINVTFDNIVWNQSHVKDDQYLEIVLVSSKTNANGLKDEAVLWMTTPTAVFEAGEFPINSTMDAFTFYSSPGYVDGGAYPCLYYQVGNNNIQAIWYITSGSVKIGYPSPTTVSVEVHAFSYYGSEINLYYNVKSEGIDEVQSAESAVRKVLRNGSIVIERNGKQYDILGR